MVETISDFDNVIVKEVWGDLHLIDLKANDSSIKPGHLVYQDTATTCKINPTNGTAAAGVAGYNAHRQVSIDTAYSSGDVVPVVPLGSPCTCYTFLDTGSGTTSIGKMAISGSSTAGCWELHTYNGTTPEDDKRLVGRAAEWKAQSATEVKVALLNLSL